MKTSNSTQLFKIFSLLLMLFNFFGVTAIWQEIPWITEASNVAETVPSIDTSSASDAVIPTVSDDVWISDELEVATIKSTEETVETEKDTFFIPIINTGSDSGTIEEALQTWSQDDLPGVIETIVSGSLSLLELNNTDNEILLYTWRNQDTTSIEEENKILNILNNIYEEYILGSDVTKGDDIKITMPKDTDISRIQILDKISNSNTIDNEADLSWSYIPFQSESNITTTPSEYLPSSLIVQTELKSEDLDLQEDITDNFVGQDGQDLSANLEKTFEFGKEGEDLIFSKPLKIEVKVDVKDQIGSYEIYTKHASDNNYNAVWLSTDPNTLCDEQGNSTLPWTQTFAVDGVVTFYTCRASDFLLLAQAGYSSSCNIPVIWTNNTSSVSIDTGSVTVDTNITNISEWANSILSITWDSIVYFTIRTGGMWIGLDNDITTGSHQDVINIAMYVRQNSFDLWQNGNDYALFADWYSPWDIFFFLLSWTEASIHKLDGSFSYVYPESITYPLYLDTNFVSWTSVPSLYVSEAKIAEMGCLNQLSFCGDEIVDAWEQCDLGTWNGTGGVCNNSCQWNTGDIDGIVTKTMSWASMCKSGDIVDITFQVDNVGISSLWTFGYLTDYLPTGMNYISWSFSEINSTWPWGVGAGWTMTDTGLIIDGGYDLADIDTGPMYTFTVQAILNQNLTWIITNFADIGPFYQRIPSIVPETWVALLNNSTSYSWDCWVCGDGNIGAGEQCDLGTLNGTIWSACDSSCQWNVASCDGIYFTPPSDIQNESTNLVNITNTVAHFPVVTWLFYDIDRDELGVNYSNALNGTSYIYTLTGLHTPVVTVYDENFDYYIQCSNIVYVGYNGECGALDGTIINTWDGINSASTWLCDPYSSYTFPTYDEISHTWSWTCEPLYSGTVANCQAEWSWCGDGIINGPELCDYNNISGISCDNSCQPTNLCDLGQTYLYKAIENDNRRYYFLTSGSYFWTDPNYLALGLDFPSSTTFWDIEFNNSDGSGCAHIGNALDNIGIPFTLYGRWDYNCSPGSNEYQIPNNSHMKMSYIYNNDTYVYELNYTWVVSGVNYFPAVTTFWQDFFIDLYGAFPVSCNVYSWTGCGNGYLEWSEACDDGNGIDTDACSNTCDLNVPSCPTFNFDITPTTWFVPTLVTGTWNTVTWFMVTSLDRGTGTPDVSPTSPSSFNYTESGNYTATLNITNALSGNVSGSCAIAVSIENAPINWICGTINGDSIYDFNNSGDSLTWWSTGLCIDGIATWFNYDTGTHSWSWSCDGIYNGTNDSCTTQELYCGDGVVGTGIGYNNEEQCDDGNAMDNDACSNICNLNIPTCNDIDFVVSPTTWIIPVMLTGTWNTLTWFTATLLNRGTSSLVFLPPNPSSYEFMDTGSYAATLTIANDLSWDFNISCNVALQLTWAEIVPPIDGICGTWNGQQVYTGTTPTDLCTTGTLIGLIQSWNDWIWSCEGYDSGATVACNAPIGYCGDGATGSGIGYNNEEQCDDWNGDDTDACSNTCSLNLPTCPAIDFNITPMTWFAPTTVTWSWNNITGFTASTLFRGTGVPVPFPTNPDTFIYSYSGSYTGTLTLSNNLSGSLSISCDINLNISNAPIDGICGTWNGQQVYTGTTPTDLCTTGTLIGLIQSWNDWIWSCEGYDSGATVACNAPVGYCGDWIIWTGIGYNNEEQCDQWSTNSLTGSCSLTCTLNIPSCNDFWYTLSAYTWIVPILITGSWNVISWFTVTGFDRGIGSPILNPTSPVSHYFTGAGNYIITFTAVNDLSGSVTSSCSASVPLIYPPIDGACGTGDGVQVYTGTEPTSLCETGISLDLHETSTGRAWSCRWLDGWADDFCNAPVGYCGDWIIWTGIGYNNEEQCDNGTGNSWTGSCSLSCTLNTPSCNDFNFNVTPNNGSVPLTVTGTWNNITGFTVTGLDRGTWISFPYPESMTSFIYTDTGYYTAILTIANDLSWSIIVACPVDISTDPNQPIPTDWICGTWNGQQVYTGTTPTDLCTTGTLIGLIQSWNDWIWSCEGYDSGATVACNAPIGYCGDGATGSGIGYNNEEQCDDGNWVDTDACSNTCNLNPISTGIYDLALIKQLSGLENTFVSGSLVTFTITVINQGNLLATNILIIDYLPAWLTLDDPNWTVVTSWFTNLIPINLASGTSQTISINARVDGDITGTITNRAEISQDDGDDIDSTPDFDQFNDIFSGNDNISWNGTWVEDEDDHDWESITVDNNRVAPYNPNITISKTGSISIYESGDMISYTINISNTGNSGQSNIQITELVSGPWGYTTGAATATGFIIEFDRIEPGEDYVLSVTGTLVGTSTQINQAVITSGSCTNCTGSWTTTLSGAIIIPPISTGEAMLSLLKTWNISTYQSWDGITYTITISNTGTSWTFNTLILEDYPVWFNYLTSSTTLGNFDTWTRERSIANIASWESAYLTITGSLFGTSNQINTAYITSWMCISCTGTVTTYAVWSWGYYDLSLSSAILWGISILYVGQQVTYVVSIVNQGSWISAHQFRIADMVPTWLTLNDPSWTLSGGMAIFDFTGTLAPGETTTKNINFIVNGAVTGIISNRVQLAEDDGFDIDSTPNNWTGLDYEDDDDFTNITVIKTISGNPWWTYVPTPTPSCPWSVGCVTPPVIPTRITPIIPVLVPPILIPPITKVIKKVLQIVYNNIYDIIEMTTPQILPTTGAEE